MRRIFLLLALPLMLASCVAGLEEELNNGEISKSQYSDLVAGFDDESRTYISEMGTLNWHEGDMLSVFYGNTLNVQYKFNGKTGDNSGTFSVVPSNELGTGNRIENIYAVYPHDAKTKMLDNNTIVVNMPSVQNYGENSFGKGANVMVAVTDGMNDNFLRFRNACGMIRLSLYGHSTVASVVLIGNNGEKIAGAATIKAVYGAMPTLSMNNEATDRIVLNCGEGVKLGETADTATEFWFVVPPTVFENGFTAVITDISGYSCMKSTTKRFDIRRNAITNMAAFEVEELAPASNEIWYTSANGEMVVPYSADVFGANIVSHTCVEGHGVITFDGDVTSVGDWAFADCSGLSHIALPETVTSIGDNAFLRCYNLTSMRIQEGVTSIGESAFYHCGALASVTIPSSVMEIGPYAFFGCKGTLVINSRVIERDNLYPFKGGKFTNVVLGERVCAIGANTFNGCSELECITFRGTISSVGNKAFYDCPKLSRFEGESVSSDHRCIVLNGNRLVAFAPAGITSYKIPDTITTIGAYAFCSCTELESITMPASITMCEEAAFTSCSNLESVYISDLSAWCKIKFSTITSANPLNNQAVLYLNGVKVTNLVIPSDIEVLNFAAFAGCLSLESVTIPESVTRIGNDAFYRCTNIRKVSMSDGVTSIGSYAFYNCSALKDLTLSAKISTIGSSAFYSCSNLEGVSLPSGVTSIGESAFYGCKALASVECWAVTPPRGADNMFGNNASNRKIYVPSYSVDAYKEAEYWSNYASYIYANENIPDNTIYYISTDGTVVKPSATDVLATFGANIVSNTYENGQGIITFDAPVTTIGDKAFYGCKSLKQVIIPRDVTSIGSNAFSHCSELVSVEIPAGVTSFGEGVFYNSTHLKTAYYQGDLSAWCKIDFVNGSSNPCCYGADLYIQKLKLTSAIIPSDITVIKTFAFRGCASIISVLIPNSVTSIGSSAFKDCTSLTSVYCEPTIPPTGGKEMFANNASERKILVPKNSLDAYKTAQYWSDYADCILPDSDIPDNTIHYISTTGAVVEPYVSDVFGANIVSNTYENGQGVITFDAPVTRVGDKAFYGLSTLMKVILPNGVVSLGASTFYNCTNLNSVHIPEGVRSIGNYAFYNCSSLTEIAIPASLTSIGIYVFRGCTKLSAFYGALASSDNRCLIIDGVLVAFAPAGLTEYTILDNVTSIGAYAFYGCSDLTGITIPDGVTSIGNYAFYGCSGLIEMTIPGGVASIGSYAFRSCAGLKNVIISSGVKSIGSYAFSYCTALTEITIPDSVTSIGAGAFRYNSSLSSVYCKPATPPTGGNYMFDDNASDRKIYVPAAFVDSYKKATYWSSYAANIVGYDF